jgi:hypothetical protein
VIAWLDADILNGIIHLRRIGNFVGARIIGDTLPPTLFFGSVDSKRL